MTSNHPLGSWLLHVTGSTAALVVDAEGLWTCRHGKTVAQSRDPIDALWDATVGGPPPSLYPTDLKDLLG